MIIICPYCNKEQSRNPFGGYDGLYRCSCGKNFYVKTSIQAEYFELIPLSGKPEPKQTPQAAVSKPQPITTKKSATPETPKKPKGRTSRAQAFTSEQVRAIDAKIEKEGLTRTHLVRALNLDSCAHKAFKGEIVRPGIYTKLLSYLSMPPITPPAPKPRQTNQPKPVRLPAPAIEAINELLHDNGKTASWLGTHLLMGSYANAALRGEEVPAVHYKSLLGWLEAPTLEVAHMYDAKKENSIKNIAFKPLRELILQEFYCENMELVDMMLAAADYYEAQQIRKDYHNGKCEGRPQESSLNQFI